MRHKKITRFLSKVFCLFLAVLSSVSAHEVRPAYLELKQTDSEIYDVLWKVPARGENEYLSLKIQFADDVEIISLPTAIQVNNTYIRQWKVKRVDGLANTKINILGLSATKTDALVRLERLDKSTQTTLVKPEKPWFIVETVPSAFGVAMTYLDLGVEHILLGIDHLLFVLALLILVKSTKQLIITVTAFTLAHSLTLAGATLGWVHLPSAPVEAIIALSIVFVAMEIVRQLQGIESLTAQYPWVVAFSFGLLHGFGFAGALSDIGLPETAIALALLFFNVGVELGQLLFITATLLSLWITRKIVKGMANQTSFSVPSSIKMALPYIPPYAIGSIAAFWVIERISSF